MFVIVLCTYYQKILYVNRYNHKHKLLLFLRNLYLTFQCTVPIFHQTKQVLQALVYLALGNQNLLQFSALSQLELMTLLSSPVLNSLLSPDFVDLYYLHIKGKYYLPHLPTFDKELLHVPYVSLI